MGDQRSLSPSAWHRPADDGCDWYLHSMFVLCLFLNVCPMGRFPRFSNGLYLQTCSGGRRYFVALTNPYNKALLVCACAADRSVFDFTDGYSDAEFDLLDLTAVERALIAGISPHIVLLPFHGQILP